VAIGGYKVASTLVKKCFKNKAPFSGFEVKKQHFLIVEELAR